MLRLIEFWVHFYKLFGKIGCRVQVLYRNVDEMMIVEWKEQKMEWVGRVLGEFIMNSLLVSDASTFIFIHLPSLPDAFVVLFPFTHSSTKTFHYNLPYIYIYISQERKTQFHKSSRKTIIIMIIFIITYDISLVKLYYIAFFLPIKTSLLVIDIFSGYPAAVSKKHSEPSLTIADTLLSAVDGAATASASAAEALPRSAVGGETLSRTSHLLIVTRTFLFTHDSVPYDPALPVATFGAAVATAISSTDDALIPALSKAGYVVKSVTRSEHPIEAAAAAVPSGGEREGRREKEDGDEKSGDSHVAVHLDAFLRITSCLGEESEDWGK